MFSKDEKYMKKSILQFATLKNLKSRGLPRFFRRSFRFSDESNNFPSRVSSHLSEFPVICKKHNHHNNSTNLSNNINSTIYNLNNRPLFGFEPIKKKGNDFSLSSTLGDSRADEVEFSHPDYNICNQKKYCSKNFSDQKRLQCIYTEKRKKNKQENTETSNLSSDTAFSLRQQVILHNDLYNKRSYKEAEFDKILSSPIVNIYDLKRLGWNGIPDDLRSQVWKLILGYLPSNSARRKQTLYRKRSEYRDAISYYYEINDDERTNQEQETLRQVLVDVPRTAPDIPLFRNDRIRYSLTRLLYILAMRHPASSYVQGINDLATPLIVVFLSGYFDGKDVLDGKILNNLTNDILDEVEADVYWCLTNLLAGIQDHYTSDQPGVQRMVMRLEELVNRIDSNLSNHLRKTGIEFMQFAFKWMNCLLLREFHLRSIIRLWDTYLSEGDGGFESFHVYVCASFLCQFSGEVQKMEFDELFGFIQNIPTSDWGDNEIEILLSQAYVLSTLFNGSDAHLTSHN